MSNIKRYYKSECVNSFSRMVEDADGNWVTFADHEEAIQKDAATIEQLIQKESAYMRGQKIIIAQLQKRCAMLVEYLENECGNKCNAEYNPCTARQLLNATSADTEKWMREQICEERERIAKVFDDMGLRPYAEVVRNSVKEDI